MRHEHNIKIRRTKSGKYKLSYISSHKTPQHTNRKRGVQSSRVKPFFSAALNNKEL